MASFTYTYPAYNGEPDVSNYAANLNYMLSTDARAFALANLVHSDGLNHFSRSGANLYEFYATGTAVTPLGTYGTPATWTIVSNPAGEPILYPGQPNFMLFVGTGVWLIGGVVTASTNQTENSFWYLASNAGNRDSKLAGDTTLLSPRVSAIRTPTYATMYAYATVATTYTFKMFGVRVGPYVA